MLQGWGLEGWGLGLADEVCDTSATSIARYEKYRCWACKLDGLWHTTEELGFHDLHEALLTATPEEWKQRSESEISACGVLETLAFLFNFWSAANGGLRDGGLSKSEDI